MAIIHHPSLARYSLFNPTLFPFDKKLLITFVDNEKGFVTATEGKLQLKYSIDGLLEDWFKARFLFDIEQKSQQKKPRIELAS